MYYKFDDKKSKKVKELNSKISEKQKQIFDILLKISKSFSDDNITKKERKELFDQVDILKSKIKEYNKELKEITSSEDSDIEEENNIQDNINKDEIINEDNEEIEQTITELEDNLKELNKDIGDSISTINASKRKKARTQLVVVEDEGVSSKIKGFFAKLKSIIK